jgi:hypothetical protein
MQRGIFISRLITAEQMASSIGSSSALKNAVYNVANKIDSLVQV